jgi:hypothetical protein
VHNAHSQKYNFYRRGLTPGTRRLPELAAMVQVAGYQLEAVKRSVALMARRGAALGPLGQRDPRPFTQERCVLASYRSGPRRWK